MSSFKYIEKNGKTYLSIGEGRMVIRWIKRLIPKAASIEILPTSITLSKSSYTLKEEATYTLVATVLPEGTTDKDLVWSSSDAEIATVNSSGKVTGVKVGTCNIICKSERDASVSATCAITVQAKQYTISFDAGEGGTGTMEPLIKDKDSIITEAPACTFSAPSEKVFDKWVDSNAQIIVFPYTVTANATFVATWKAAA